MKHALLVLGPAGSGKTTFCRTIIEHCQNLKRPAHLMNLDPAAEFNHFKANVDIMEYWPLDKIMENTGLGPNGGLIHCLESMLYDKEFLDDALSGYHDDFLIVDCPGQIEIFLHTNIMKDVIEIFKENDYFITVAFLLDSQFVQDRNKFLAGALNAMSAMIRLQVPHVNIITKLDLLDNIEYETLNRFLVDEMPEEGKEVDESFTDGRKKLEVALKAVLRSFDLVDFIPFNSKDEESIRSCMIYLDNMLQNDDFERGNSPVEPLSQ